MSLFFFNKEERIKHQGFDDLFFMLIGIPLLGLFIPIAFFNFDWTQLNFNYFFFHWFDSCIHVIVYWVGFRAFVHYVRKKYPGFQFTNKRIILQIIFIIIYGFVMAMFLELLLHKWCLLPNESTPLQGAIATYFTSIFVMSIYEGVYLYYQNQKNILMQESLKREHIKSELQGLKDQVNPHFLFNSLNTLTNIIHEDQDLATSFLKNMSDVYRYILERRDEQLIPLKDELKFIESYVFLQKERFKNNLEVSIEISDHYLEKNVVPLSLQILFENAIKHNVISSKYPLHIEVFVDVNHNLVILNEVRRKSQSLPSTGVGLKNITSRYAYFTDRPVKILEEENSFIVKIPLLDSEL